MNTYDKRYQWGLASEVFFGCWQKVEFFVPFESAAQILESVGIGENTSIHLAGISCYQCVFLSF